MICELNGDEEWITWEIDLFAIVDQHLYPLFCTPESPFWEIDPIIREGYTATEDGVMYIKV